MTAAIPPACCAGADHGTPHASLLRIGRADGRGFVVAGANAYIVRIGAGILRNQLLAVAYAERQPITVANADLYTLADTVADINARQRVVA